MAELAAPVGAFPTELVLTIKAPFRQHLCQWPMKRSSLCGRVPPDGSRQVQRRFLPEEIEELVAGYVAGATAVVLAAKHPIHRTTVLALLERHQVSRRGRGRVLTPGHIERAVSRYASGRSCASIGKELQVNPEMVRQALLKAGVAMRRPGRPRPPQES